MENSNISHRTSTEITREELASVAYMCYILDRTQTTRWYHEWRVALDRMGREGWTMKGLYYRGLVRQKIEQVYGLSPYHSRKAVKAYPPVNLGLEPWQEMTDECLTDLARQIYREYVGLPREGYTFRFSSGQTFSDNAGVQNEDFTSGQDNSDDEDMGGFYFT